jgi:hypothetical protein
MNPRSERSAVARLLKRCLEGRVVLANELLAAGWVPMVGSGLIVFTAVFEHLSPELQGYIKRTEAFAQSTGLSPAVNIHSLSGLVFLVFIAASPFGLVLWFALSVGRLLAAAWSPGGRARLVEWVHVLLAMALLGGLLWAARSLLSNRGHS